MFRLLFSVASLAAISATISDCDTTSVFQSTSMTFSPDPPSPGQQVDIALVFTNTGPEVAEGLVYTSLNVNGLPLQQIDALCGQTVCPIYPGAQERRNSTIWPDVTGKIVSQVQWVGAANESLLCYKIVTRVGQTKELIAV